MIRTVIDTNVFVTSFRGGNPKRVVDLWRQGRITLCLSLKILEEYRRVLAIVDLSQAKSAELLTIFESGHSLVFTSRTPTIAAVKADPDDDKFIECAVALKAECIITGDKALKAVGDYEGIGIMSPAEFLTKFSLYIGESG